MFYNCVMHMTSALYSILHKLGSLSDVNQWKEGISMFTLTDQCAMSTEKELKYD